MDIFYLSTKFLLDRFTNNEDLSLNRKNNLEAHRLKYMTYIKRHTQKYSSTHMRNNKLRTRAFSHSQTHISVYSNTHTNTHTHRHVPVGHKKAVVVLYSPVSH